MPKIQWNNLPPALRDHLFDRLRERQISVEDLYRLKQWRESEPEAPDGFANGPVRRGRAARAASPDCRRRRCWWA